MASWRGSIAGCWTSASASDLQRTRSPCTAGRLGEICAEHNVNMWLEFQGESIQNAFGEGKELFEGENLDADFASRS